MTLVAAGAVAQAAARGPMAAPRAPVCETVLEDIQYADGVANEPRRNRLDLYLPAAAPVGAAGATPAAGGTPHTGGPAASAAKPAPMVMFVHGGAWTGGNKEFGAWLAHALVQRGIACACINTQLFPFVRPDAMVADCGRALAWLHAHAGEHGYDGDRLFLMGHSAGGHLVSWLALDDTRRAATGVPAAALRGCIALSGVHELRSRHPALDKVFGPDMAKRRDASPFAHASAGDPPMLLLWGEHDMPGLSLCSRMLRDRLRDVGTAVIAEELVGRNHVDYLAPLGTPGDRVFDRIVAFVRQPPAAVAPVAPCPDLVRSTVRLAAGQPRLDVVAPASGTRTTLVWLVDDAPAAGHAERLARALAPHGVAVARLAGAGMGAPAVAMAWRELRAQAGALALPAPSVLGGYGAAAGIVADTQLARVDGLRARLLVAANPGPGAAAAAAAARLGRAGPGAPSVLLAQGGADDKARRDEVVAVGTLLAQRQVDVHVIEVPGVTSDAALQQLGAADDVLLPLLRAFVLP